MTKKVIYLLIVSFYSFNLYALEPPSTKKFTIVDNDISVRIYNAENGEILIWLPSETGFIAERSAIAQQLTQFGIETWAPDLLGALFLPQVSSSYSKIPPRLVAGVLKMASEKERQVFVLAEGDSVITALRGAMYYQSQQPTGGGIAGLILLSGKFLIETPNPGEKPQWYPIVDQAQAPIYLLQPNKSPWFWTMPDTVAKLKSAGSAVQTQILNQMRDRFYYRVDAAELEKQSSRFLPEWIANGMTQLKTMAISVTTVKQSADKKVVIKPKKKSKKLRLYPATKSTPELILNDLMGKRRNLANIRNRVVLVNFWASWCPPCVHEIPSLNKLSQKFGDELVIVGVNMAEDVKTINQFLEKTNIEFMILLDEDGAALKRWQVYAFPTSFLLAKDGSIKYGVVGAIDWMQKDVIDKISELNK